MRDEQDSRIWAEHHQAFSAQVAQLIDKLCNVFKVLNAYQFHAPWEGVAQQPMPCSRRNCL